MESLVLAGRRLGWRDIALTVLACIACVFYLIGDRAEDVHKPSIAACVSFFLIMLPLAFRRVAPLAAVGATLALLLVNIVLFGEFVRCGILIPLGMILVFSVGAQLGGRASWLGLGLIWAFFLAICLFDSDEGAQLDAMLFLVPVSALVWGAGRLLRSRSQVSAALSARTAELQDARDRRTRLEVTADRARVSGELDELLQRRLGELAAMAEAGSAATDPAAAAAALEEIEGESRRTLDQMRAVVGVLRDDPETNGRAPQPALTHLEALLLRARGSDARLIVEGNPRALPAGVELAAYRIVEQLLDTLEDVPVDVTVRFGDDALELAVSGPARRTNAAAIKRAQERVQLYSGTLRSSVQGGRAESIASLPMLAGA